MRESPRLAILLTLFTVLVSPSRLGVAISASSSAKLNIVLITIDTLRVDRLGAYGYRQAITPNLDGLARRGTRFDQAIGHAPLTFPSHVSILTGQLPLVHGIRDNGSEVADPKTDTVAARLHAAGYRTAAFVSSFILSAQFGLDTGFEQYDDRLPAQGPLVDYGVRRRATDVADAAALWIAGHATQPFFAWVHFYDVHAPYADAVMGRDPYDVAVTAADTGVGRILSALTQAGVSHRTAIIVTGDHGEGLGDHGEREHGLLVYDSVIHVPLIIDVPDGPAQVIGSQAPLIDLAPTMLSLAGVPATDLPGRDLSPRVRGARVPVADDEDAYGESWYGRLHFGWSEIRFLRVDGWKYIDAPDPELYDVRHDPAESANVLTRHRELAAAMKQRLAAMTTTRGAGVHAAPRSSDPQVVARLRSLGYVAGAGPEIAPASSGAADPKRMIGVFQDYSTRLNEGIGELAASRPDRAIDRFRKLVAEFPESYEAHHYLGYALGAARRDGEAVPEYERALQLRPTYAVAHFDAARSLAALRQFEHATRHVEAGLALEPRSVYGHISAGIVAWARTDNRGAVAAFARAAELAPGEPRAFANLGEACMRVSDLGCAQQCFARLVALDYARAAAHFNLGVIAERQGAVDRAKAEYHEALAEDPRLEQARTALRKLGDR